MLEPQVNKNTYKNTYSIVDCLPIIVEMRSLIYIYITLT